MIRRNRRPDWRRIKTLRSYTIDEAARLLRIHRNSVRYWIKGGLPVLADRRPHLILGATSRRFSRSGGKRENKDVDQGNSSA
jgi:hypothetical protein